MWRVINHFVDIQDGRHPYNVGDAFPRPGHEVSEDRLKELSTAANRQKVPLIEEIKEAEPPKKRGRKAKA